MRHTKNEERIVILSGSHITILYYLHYHITIINVIINVNINVIINVNVNNY